MAISTFGGASSSASVSVGAPIGYGLISGGYASTGRHVINNPLPGRYIFQANNSTGIRTVVEYTSTGNTVENAFSVSHANALGVSSNVLTSVAGSAYVAGYYRWASTGSFAGSQNFTAVAHFNGIWFAGNANGDIYTSVNGTNWTFRASITVGAAVRAFTWNQSTSSPLYSAVGFTASAFLWATSTDATTWTNRGAADNLMDITYGNGVWVANYVNSYMKVSTNGTSWTSTPTAGTGSNMQSVTHNGLTGASSVFVTVGVAGKIATSGDGATWTARTSGTAADLNSVAYANGLFVAVGNTGVILTSPDGITWTLRAGVNVLTTGKFLGVHYGGGRWIAMTSEPSSSGTPNVGMYTSLDAITWRPISGDGSNTNMVARPLAYGQNKWMATTSHAGNGALGYSADGLNGIPTTMVVFGDTWTTLN